MWGAIAAIAAPVIANVIGGHIASGDSGNAGAAAQRAYQELMNIGLPPDLSKELILQKFQEAGILTPEVEQTIKLGPSKVSQITEDPETRDAQLSALKIIQEAATTGFTPESRSELNKIRDEVARDAESRRQQIVQNFQARGMGGSGAELASTLQSEQTAANQASRQGDELSAEASRRALDSAFKSGQLGGDIRGQDFDVNKVRSSAEDEFSRFNVQNQQSTQNRNTDRLNRAAEANLINKQDISNENTELYNTEKLRANEAKRDYWLDLAKRAQLRSGAEGDEADRFNARAQRTRNQYATIGGAVGSGLNKYLSDAPKTDKDDDNQKNYTLGNYKFDYNK